MEPRLDFYKASPSAIKALLGLEDRIAKSGVEKPLDELVRLRASQIDSCAFCVDMHTADARKGGETDRRLASVSVSRAGHQRVGFPQASSIACNALNTMERFNAAASTPSPSA
jgi:AhpD family alkylhydroperoxidase